MSDVKCPYCREYQEINHDDGHGLCEDQVYEQDCVVCDRTFLFDVTTTLSYEVKRREG